MLAGAAAHAEPLLAGRERPPETGRPARVPAAARAALGRRQHRRAPAAAARRRRRAHRRRSVAARAALHRPAHRGPAARDRAHGAPAAGERRAAATRSSALGGPPARTPARAARAERARRSRRSCAASSRTPTTPSARRARARPAATRSSCASCSAELAASGDRARPPSRPTASGRSGRRRSRARRARGSSDSRPARRRSRTPSRCSATAALLAQAAALAGLEPGRGDDRERRAGRRRRAAPGRRASASRIRSCARRSTSASPPRERAQLHLDAAELLRDERPGGERSAPRRTCCRRSPAGAAWVVECLHVGAQRALAGGAPETAANYLLRALDESPPDSLRATLLIDLGRAEALAGQPSAVARLRAAVALLEQPQERARALAQLGQALYAAGDNPGAASAFDEGLRVLERRRPGAGGGADGRLSRRRAPRLPHARGGADALQGPAGGIDRGGDAGAARAARPARARARDARQRDARRRRRADPPRAGRRPHAARGHLRRGRVCGSRRRRCCSATRCDDVEPTTSAGLEDARRRGSVDRLRGDVGRPRRLALPARRHRRARSATSRAGWSGCRSWCSCGRSRTAGRRSRTSSAGSSTQAERLVGVPDGEDDATSPTTGRCSRAAGSRSREGEPEQALEDLLECGRRQLAVPAPNPAVLPWRSEAALAALAARPHRAGAQSWPRRSCALARAFGSPRALGHRAARGRARRGRRRAASRCWRRPSRRSSARPSRLEHARALVDLGAAQRARRASARRRARRCATGLDAAHHCGATALADVARAELVAAGARPRRPAVRGADALTPSERRVAELAERGLTNREIAQALFISTKTVEFHLRNAYLKLRIRSRARARRGAARRSAPRRRRQRADGRDEPVAGQARP